MTPLLDYLFRICLLLFLLGGLGIVATQLAAVLLGDEILVTAVADTLGPPTYVLAGITGLLGFVLAYLKGWDTSE